MTATPSRYVVGIDLGTTNCSLAYIDTGGDEETAHPPDLLIPQVVQPRAAGLEHITLLEEPQAAFYAWIDASHDKWRKQVEVGDAVLICDVGGGTTDLTLIAVGEEAGQLALTRVAVGDHILLGGDNMDLALAHSGAQAFLAKNIKLDAAQMMMLGHSCRAAKEKLFADPSLPSAPVTVLGRGS